MEPLDAAGPPRISPAPLPSSERLIALSRDNIPWHLDTSSRWSVPRYAAFVVATASLTSLAMFATPAMLIARASPCRNLGGCYSLERDLMESIDSSVHPCDDLYRHVCHGWEKRQLSTPPLRRYGEQFDYFFVWNLLRRPIPKRPHTALDKASSMLLHCVKESASKGGAALREFLLDVGLPWPHKSPATRQQMLDLLVRFSLELGMPTLWKFFVGRHLSKPTENTIFMALDTRYHDWSEDVELLRMRGLLHRHLRRAAEVVGGTGRSYSTMIQHVLDTHELLSSVVRDVGTTYLAPQYVKLSDYDLRLAINGYLPDDSQLWIEDTIVNLQPGIFSALDEHHLRSDGARERFKLFFGAYVVWALSPLLDSNLERAMHIDIADPRPPLRRKIQDCFASVGHLMPLVSWKVQTDYVQDKPRAWRLLDLLARSTVTILAEYSEEISARAVAAMSHLGLNALNMSDSWPMLDHIYHFIPAAAGNGSYFDRYRRAAQASVSLWKRSIRKPKQSTYHLPDASREVMYRILVTREIAIPCFQFLPPLMVTDHPLAVPLGIVGTQIVSNILALLHVVLLFDDQFKIFNSLQSLVPLLEDVLAFVDHFHTYLAKLTGLQNVTATEKLDVTYRSIAALVATDAVFAHGVETAKPATSPASPPFGGIPEIRLFFLVACFMECGGTGRSRSLKMAYCNSALPTVREFNQAFHCTPRHLLKSSFTWLDVAFEYETRNSSRSRLGLQPGPIVSG